MGFWFFPDYWHFKNAGSVGCIFQRDWIKEKKKLTDIGFLELQG